MTESSNLHPLLKVVQSPVTNVYFFLIVSVSFLLYATSEIYSATYSNSLCLLGDSTALTVEILTFITIMLMDLIKAQSGCGELSYSLLILLDVFLPLLFLAALVVVIVYIVIQASVTIDSNGEGFLAVNTTYLYLFALANFVFHLLNSSAFHCKCPDVWSNKSPVEVPAVSDSAGDGLLRNPEETNVPSSSDNEANDNENINPTSGRSNNNYGTHTSVEEESNNPLISGKAFLQQMNQTLLNIVTVWSIDVIRGAVVLITAIIISTTSVSSAYADAVASLFVVATMIPMFIPVVWKYCCVNTNH